MPTVADACQRRADGSSPSASHDRLPEQRTPTSRYGAAARDDELDQVERSSKGFRTHTLFKAAAALGELVEGGELDRIATVARLEDAGRLVGLSEGDIRRQVRRGFEQGKRRPRRAPEAGPCLVGAERSHVVVELSAWWERASTAEWPGLPGSTRLRVLAGLYLLALNAGKVELSDSLRQVSEACGLAHVTVLRHRDALAPWVTLASRGDRRTAQRHRWRICLAAGGAHEVPGRMPTRPTGDPAGSGGLVLDARPPVAGTLTDPTHDVWGRWSGGWRLFCLLDVDEGLTTRQLAEATGYSVGTVRRSLARLGTMGLAHRDDDLAWRLVPDAVPREEDVGDWAERRRHRHFRQRIQYRKYRRARLAVWEAARKRQAPPGDESVPPPVDPETGEPAELPTRPAPPPSVDPDTGEITRRAA